MANHQWTVVQFCGQSYVPQLHCERCCSSVLFFSVLYRGQQSVHDVRQLCEDIPTGTVLSHCNVFVDQCLMCVYVDDCRPTIFSVLVFMEWPLHCACHKPWIKGCYIVLMASWSWFVLHMCLWNLEPLKFLVLTSYVCISTLPLLRVYHSLCSVS